MAMSPTETAPSNSLVAGLPRKDRDRLLEQCTQVDLMFGEALCEAGSLYRHVYFPCVGLISLVHGVDGHPPLEMGMIGTEGVLGASLVLGVPTAPLSALVQGEGFAWRIAVAPFLRILKASPGLQQALQRYLYAHLSELAQTAVCTRFHEVGLRLARWLLMTQDRNESNRLHLTHQFLADMLGVRRSAVTIAAGKLQERGLIEYTRGEITILDRPGLEAASCECYGRLRSFRVRRTRAAADPPATASAPSRRRAG